MADNTITIKGNLTRDPELRFTQGGTAMCNLGVAVNRRYQQNGEWVDAPTQFFNITVWGQYGENVAASVNKGDRVLVEGRLEFREYESKEGHTVKTHDIIADEVCVSLRYATATVARIQRTTGQGPVSDAEHSRQSAQQSSPQGRPADPIYSNEEPF